MKLHVGCGTVYLDGYVNVDMNFPGINLAPDRPDLVEVFRTTDDDYYGRHKDQTIEKWRSGATTSECVCDQYGEFERLPCGTGQATEVYSRQVWEHMSIREARRALAEIDRVLAPNGVLRISIPDHEESLRRYRVTGDDFYARHIHGTRRNDGAFHVMAYTRQGLIDLCEESALTFDGDEPNIHAYPAITLRFRKEPSRYAHEYIKTDVRDGAKIIEIGPGRRHWNRASAWVDISQEHLDAIPNGAGRKVLFDLDTLSGAVHLPFGDKEFDYLFCSHVMEHLERPDIVAREFSRIARAGILIMPSFIKDGLFLMEEGDHRWHVFPPLKPGGAPGFIPVEYTFRQAVTNRDATGALSRLVRHGGPGGNDNWTLRRWWAKAEPNLDIAHRWTNECRVEIVRWE